MTDYDVKFWETKAWIARYTCVTPEMVDQMTPGQFSVFTSKLRECIKSESGGDK